MNNRRHLACEATNITNTTYTTDLKDYNITIANRMMDVDRNRGMKGGLFTFSPQDFLYSYERGDMIDIAIALDYRSIGGAGIG